MKTNERQIKIYKYLFLFIGCMSFQQIGSTSIISKMLPPLSGLVTSPPPRIVPAANIQHNQGIIWRLPQNLPDLTIIPAIPEDSPSSVQNPETVKIEKQAARMIVIRRRKMKKHKLRKLRKVRKFEYRRMALKRKNIKEKAFQMKLDAQVREAESFDARAYVTEMIRKAKEDIVDNRKNRFDYLKKNPALVDEQGKKLKLNQHLYGKK